MPTRVTVKCWMSRWAPAGAFLLAGLSSVTPMLGLARQESELRSRQGRQVLWDSDHARRVGIAGSVPLGEFAGLDSSYQPVWESVWVGLDGEFRPSERLSLRGGVKQHWFRYQAEADWNLRDDLAHPVSFRHQGDGTGWQAEVGADWLVVPGHKLTLNVSGSRFTLQDGKRHDLFPQRAKRRPSPQRGDCRHLVGTPRLPDRLLRRPGMNDASEKPVRHWLPIALWNPCSRRFSPLAGRYGKPSMPGAMVTATVT
jgi:hypothetical protein